MNLQGNGSNWNWMDGTDFSFEASWQAGREMPYTVNCGLTYKSENGFRGWMGHLCTSSSPWGFVCERDTCACSCDSVHIDEYNVPMISDIAE